MTNRKTHDNKKPSVGELFADGFRHGAEPLRKKWDTMKNGAKETAGRVGAPRFGQWLGEVFSTRIDEIAQNFRSWQQQQVEVLNPERVGPFSAFKRLLYGENKEHNLFGKAWRSILAAGGAAVTWGASFALAAVAHSHQDVEQTGQPNGILDTAKGFVHMISGIVNDKTSAFSKIVSVVGQTIDPSIAEEQATL